jgi:anti-sigma28 factor (negative regulator of flagellin synthesis)
MEDYKMAVIDAVIAQIKVDIADGNYEVIAEMLDYLPNNVLEAFLSEVI